MRKVNLSQRLATFGTHWDPKIVAELNGQHVKLVKFRGEFVWHSHETEDELFLVVKGSFDMQLRGQTLTVGEGELVVVPHGVEHCPRARDEVHVLLFEPATTVNTGAREATGRWSVPRRSEWVGNPGSRQDCRRLSSGLGP